MEAITKVSDITVTDIADYLRLPEVSESDMAFLGNILGVAKTFVQSYTGQTDLDNFQDFVIVVFVLCQDMWDTRTLYVDKSNLNKVVDAILGMHSINLLPEAEEDNA